MLWAGIPRSGRCPKDKGKNAEARKTKPTRTARQAEDLEYNLRHPSWDKTSQFTIS